MEIINKEGKDLDLLLNEVCEEYNITKNDFDFIETITNLNFITVNIF